MAKSNLLLTINIKKCTSEIGPIKPQEPAVQFINLFSPSRTKNASEMKSWQEENQ